MPLLTNAVSRMEEMQVTQTTVALHWSFGGQGEKETGQKKETVMANQKEKGDFRTQEIDTLKAKFECKIRQVEHINEQ